MNFKVLAARRGLTQRLRGPGGLYNIGNALGLVSGLSLHVAASMGQQGPGLHQGMAAALHYLGGSTGAVAITLAMGIFFWSGEHYRRAWAFGFPPDPAQNRAGDISSGLGALMLGLGLFWVGEPLLAATTGLMHAVGKFGSALAPQTQQAIGLTSQNFRRIVVASRIPAVLLVLLTIAEATTADTVMGAVALLGCYALWLSADLILLRAED